MTGFDWGALMRLGLRDLRLRPADFWGLSPAELLVMLGMESGGSASMARDRLEELSRQWPDVAPKESDDG